MAGIGFVGQEADQLDRSNRQIDVDPDARLAFAVVRVVGAPGLAGDELDSCLFSCRQAEQSVRPIADVVQEPGRDLDESIGFDRESVVPGREAFRDAGSRRRRRREQPAQVVGRILEGGLRNALRDQVEAAGHEVRVGQRIAREAHRQGFHRHELCMQPLPPVALGDLLGQPAEERRSVVEEGHRRRWGFSVDPVVEIGRPDVRIHEARHQFRQAQRQEQVVPGERIWSRDQPFPADRWDAVAAQLHLPSTNGIGLGPRITPTRPASLWSGLSVVVMVAAPGPAGRVTAPPNQTRAAERAPRNARSPPLPAPATAGSRYGRPPGQGLSYAPAA